MVITKKQIIAWLYEAANIFENNQDFLTDLDRQIGDADHGLNMNRGFREVKNKLPSFTDNDIGNILKSTGMTLLSSIGGASGPLTSSFFLRAASSVMGKEQLNLAELTNMLKEGVEGIVLRGKAKLGDKTMVDTWSRVVESLTQHQNAGMKEALDVAVIEAELAMKATIPMQAHKGRASYLGERSIGHQDPGATSAYLLFKALRDVTITKNSSI